MGDIEPTADLATGGTVARATASSAEAAADGHTHERNCLNCGCELSGEYCSCCGQRAHVHRTLSAFFHDLLHGVFHFEGKIWRTLPMLVWRPGDLTRRYIEGQRARFISPVALFLFSVFLMFAVVSATGNMNPDLGTTRDLVKIETDAKAEIAGLEKEKAASKNDPKAIAAIDKSIADARQDLEAVRDLRARGITEATFSRTGVTVNSKLPWVEEAYHRAKQNPELLLYKVKSDSYKWSWAIIPLSVPFLWLLFPFNRSFRTYDHVVFVTYSLCFMTLMIAAGTLLAAIGIPDVAVLLPFIPPIHIYRQLRGAYGIGRAAALWRTIVLLVAAILVLAMFITLMVGLGVMH